MVAINKSSALYLVFTGEEQLKNANLFLHGILELHDEKSHWVVYFCNLSALFQLKCWCLCFHYWSVPAHVHYVSTKSSFWTELMSAFHIQYLLCCLDCRQTYIFKASVNSAISSPAIPVWGRFWYVIVI